MRREGWAAPLSRPAYLTAAAVPPLHVPGPQSGLTTRLTAAPPRLPRPTAAPTAPTVSQAAGPAWALLCVRASLTRLRTIGSWATGGTADCNPRLRRSHRRAGCGSCCDTDPGWFSVTAYEGVW